MRKNRVENGLLATILKDSTRHPASDSGQHTVVLQEASMDHQEGGREWVRPWPLRWGAAEWNWLEAAIVCIVNVTDIWGFLILFPSRKAATQDHSHPTALTSAHSPS